MKAFLLAKKNVVFNVLSIIQEEVHSQGDIAKLAFLIDWVWDKLLTHKSINL